MGQSFLLLIWVTKQLRQKLCPQLVLAKPDVGMTVKHIGHSSFELMFFSINKMVQRKSVSILNRRLLNGGQGGYPPA